MTLMCVLIGNILLSSKYSTKSRKIFCSNFNDSNNFNSDNGNDSDNNDSDHC